MMSSSIQTETRIVASPGLLYRLLSGGLALALLVYASRLLGAQDPLEFVDLTLALPVLVSWGAILLLRFQELRGIELHLRRKPARVSLSASRLALRSGWRHTWQFGLLLLLIKGVDTLHNIQDINGSGHLLASLLIGLLYLLLLSALVVTPLEIALARRAEELA